MNKYSILVFIFGILALNGCAARNPNIVIDPQGVDMGKYQTDLAQCQQLSMQVESKAGKGLIGGAVVGAVAGNIVGDSKSAKKGGKLGALGGFLKGAAATKQERLTVVKNCLRYRNYGVLN